MEHIGRSIDDRDEEVAGSEERPAATLPCG